MVGVLLASHVSHLISSYSIPSWPDDLANDPDGASFGYYMGGGKSRNGGMEGTAMRLLKFGGKRPTIKPSSALLLSFNQRPLSIDNISSLGSGQYGQGVQKKGAPKLRGLDGFLDVDGDYNSDPYLNRRPTAAKEKSKVAEEDDGNKNIKKKKLSWMQKRKQKKKAKKAKKQADKALMTEDNSDEPENDDELQEIELPFETRKRNLGRRRVPREQAFEDVNPYRGVNNRIIKRPNERLVKPEVIHDIVKENLNKYMAQHLPALPKQPRSLIYYPPSPPPPFQQPFPFYPLGQYPVVPSSDRLVVTGGQQPREGRVTNSTAHQSRNEGAEDGKENEEEKRIRLTREWDKYKKDLEYYNKQVEYNKAVNEANKANVIRIQEAVDMKMEEARRVQNEEIERQQGFGGLMPDDSFQPARYAAGGGEGGVEGPQSQEEEGGGKVEIDGVEFHITAAQEREFRRLADIAIKEQQLATGQPISQTQRVQILKDVMLKVTGTL